MKKVLFISYFFPPSAGSAAKCTAPVAKYLREFGYEPIVLAPEPRTFAEDPLSLGVDPSGDAEIPRDVRVCRVPPCEPFELLRLLKKLKLLWVFHFFARPDERLTWSLAAIAKGLDVARSENVDLICQNLGPWSTSATGYVLKSVLQKPLVYDINDPWTQWALGVWPTPLHFALERRMESRVLAKADGISMRGDTYRAELLQAHPELDPAKVVVFPNGYDSGRLPPREELQRGRLADGLLRIVHAGKFYDTWGRMDRTVLSATLKSAYDATLGRLRYSPRGLDTAVAGPRFLLEGLALARQRDPAAGRIRLEFIGRVQPDVRRQVAALGLGDVVSLPGPMPHDQCLRKLFQADALFLPLFRWRDGARMGVLPLKLYEYMATGNPVLAAVSEGDLKDTLERAGTGIFVRPDSPGDFADALLRLQREHAGGGVRVAPDWDYIRQFERRALTGRLAKFMDAVLENHARGRLKRKGT
ncbi:MAG: glycosyltransferase family 4 protein [Candidatus Brocadiia bacterium]